MIDNKHFYIKECFINLESLKDAGIFLSGIKGEGELKAWHSSGELYRHYFYKDGKRNGECKNWHRSGQLFYHKLYKDDKLIKDYLK